MAVVVVMGEGAEAGWEAGLGGVEVGEEACVDVVEAVHPTKPQLISKHVLPAAMSTLMNEKNLDIKAANSSLIKAMARCVGKEALVLHAQAISPAAERKMEQCLSGK